MVRNEIRTVLSRSYNLSTIVLKRRDISNKASDKPTIYLEFILKTIRFVKTKSLALSYD